MSAFDYIIIGAGAAGCVLANRLTANPKISVLLIEAGGKDTSPWNHIPGGYFKTMHNPNTDCCFETQKDLGLGNRRMNFFHVGQEAHIQHPVCLIQNKNLYLVEAQVFLVV